MTVTLVVAMGTNGVIGAEGGIPWHLPADLAHFKQLTLGHPIVMGRKTYDSIGRPLPGRTTIVVTRREDWSAEGVQVAGSLPDALALAEVLDDDVFLVGGAQIYAEAMASGSADRMSVTHVNLAPDGDTMFPEVHWADWAEVTREDHPDSTPPFAIVTYDHR
jgi:dihydrofolate reductase